MSTENRMRKSKAGFTVIELLVSIVLVSIMMTVVVSSFAAQNKAAIQQDRHTEMEENLRVSMHYVTDALRNAGYGTPRANLNLWLSPDFGTSRIPLILGDNSLKMAACTAIPVATVAVATTAPGGSSLTVDSTEKISVGQTLWIGRAEFVKITGKTSSTISFDTNPVASGTTGMFRPYPVGTPICRVDTQTFTVSPDNQTLTYDRGDGSGSQLLAEKITSMQITTVTARQRYSVTLTGIMKDVKTNQNITQSISSDVAFVN